MSALAIESQAPRVAVPGRLAPTRPASRRPERRPASMPPFSQVLPLRGGHARACGVSAPVPSSRAGHVAATSAAAGEWHLTQRGMAVGVAFMSLVAVLSVVTVVLQYLAIPA